VLLAIIGACEVGFWALLAAGMVVRYLFRMPKLGAALLLAVPVVDVVMLVASVVDLRRGGEPSLVHSLAAIFIGVSVGFGHHTIRWADRWAAHKFQGAPRPVKPPKGGPARARHERQGWYRHLLAYAVGSGLMSLGYLLTDERAIAGPVWPWTIVLVIDGIVSFSYGSDRDDRAELAESEREGVTAGR
jgi:hypothetical protein